MSDEEVRAPNNLICNVQSIGSAVEEDCDLMLVSDGKNWRCPYNHVQYRDDTGMLRREIPDRRRQ